MSKAILVIDMPSSCKECNMSVLARESHTGQMCFRCVHYPTIMVLTKETKRPDWCPIKPMPNKIGMEESCKMPRSGCIADVINSYNACIDEIMKGSEENE